MFRLDFETFTVLGPTPTTEVSASCQDTLQLTGGSGLTTPVLCGKLTGQHLYVDAGGGATDTSTLQLTIGSTSSTIRTWEMKISQIECSNQGRPYDTGCLQYHTGTTGRITTFNFQESSSPIHLSNQAYSICIRQEQGFCCIQYTLCSDSRSWSIDNMGTTASAANTDTNCDEDYLGIEGVMEACNQGNSNTLHSRICGQVFGATQGSTIAATFVCDCTSPFMIQVYTDATNDDSDATAAATARGACLNYQLQTCENP